MNALADRFRQWRPAGAAPDCVLRIEPVSVFQTEIAAGEGRLARHNSVRR